MKTNYKKNRFDIITFLILYIMCVVCLFWFHPFVACAAETDTASKKVPGGKGNKVVFSSVMTFKNVNSKNTYGETLKAGGDFEIVGCIESLGDLNTSGYYEVYFRVVNENGTLSYLNKNNLADCTGFFANYENGVLKNSKAYSMDNILKAVCYKSPNDYQTITCSISGCKIFKDSESMLAYAQTGSLDGMIKDEIDREFYLKDVKAEYNKNGSPSPEADSDVATFDFTWLTDNLQDGDLLEVKTHNYVIKLNGDKISGFLDYITWGNNVSAYDGEYSILRYAPVNEWIKTLDYNPILPRDKDTDIYFLRPYRNGTFGVWVRIKIGRHPNGDPYVEEVTYGDFDDDDWVEDDDLTEREGWKPSPYFPDDNDDPFGSIGIIEIFKKFFEFMKSLPSLLGDLPELVETIIGFLPDWVIAFIGIAVVVVIILRVIGR